MNILCVTTCYPLHSASVSGVFVKNLVNALVARGHAVRVLVPDDPKAEGASSSHNITRVRYAPLQWQTLAHASGGIPEALKRTFWNAFPLGIMFIRLAWQSWRFSDRCDAIIANWSLSSLCALLGRRKKSISIVTVLRGSDVNVAARGKLGRYLLGFVVKHSNAVVCVSFSLKMELEQLYPYSSTPLLVIENGVSMDEKSTSNRLVSGHARKFRLIFVGNLTANKGVDTILDALKHLRDELTCLQMDFIGGGDINFYNAEAAIRGLSNVNFLGQMPQENVLKHVGEADVFINASFSEGRSNAVVEALACGTPVVASDIASNRELLGDGQFGTLFSPGSSASLAEALLNAVNNYPLLRDKASDARRRYCGRGWDQCAAEYEALLMQLRAP